MGWSYYVPCKSRKAQEQMLTFLEEHYTPLSRLDPKWPKDHWRQWNPLLPSDFVAYDRNTSCYIGYDKPGDYEQAVLRWIAFRVGKCRKFVKRLGISDVVPWMNYDGKATIPVITQEQWERTGDRERTKQYVVDEIGWQRPRRFWEDLVRWPNPELIEEMTDYISKFDRNDKLFRAEIARLDKLWLETLSK